MWFKSDDASVSLRQGGAFKRRYRGFRRLVAANSEMLELEADLHHLHPRDYAVRGPVMRPPSPGSSAFPAYSV